MPNALVIGTDHAFQRHQDLSAKNAAKRTAYTEFLSTSLEARNVDALAEEAGDDQEVWECLKSQELGIPTELRGLFAGTEIVDAHSVLVVVGEQHRAEVARILGEKYGWTTGVASFL
jgi:hypothetical protein